MACVYKHVFADNVTYFGNGQSTARAYDNRSRNKKWQQALEKFGKYDIEVIADNMSEEEADALERSLFLDYVANGGVKLQHTPSGKDLSIQTKRSKRSNGMTGHQHSEAAKQRMRASAIGHTRNLGRKATLECCENISKAKTGRPNWKIRGVPKSQQARENQSKAAKGPTHSSQLKMISSLDGRISNACGAGKISKNNPDYVGTWSVYVEVNHG